MILSIVQSQRIIASSLKFVGKRFDYQSFNCVHFVRSVYDSIGLVIPMLDRYDLPPREFHLSADEFVLMPLGSTVFFKRRESVVDRYWTHVAIIIGPDELIHCTRHLGTGVTITSKSEFLQTYSLAPCFQE